MTDDVVLDELLDAILEAVGDAPPAGEFDAPGAELAALFDQAAAELPTTTTELRDLRRRVRAASRHSARVTAAYRQLVGDMAAIRDAVAAVKGTDD